MCRHLAKRRRFTGHHMGVEVGRTTDGLARVVDDEVEAVARGHQVAAEGLRARRVAQVEAEDLEPVCPVAEVGFLRVARRGVAREARRDHEVRSGSEKLEARLVANLDATTREQRDAAPQVGQLRAGGKVELRARGAELVVEDVHVGMPRLADVAVPLVDGLSLVRRGGVHVSWFKPLRRNHVRGGDNGASAQRADSRVVQDGVFTPDALILSLTIRGPGTCSLRVGVRHQESGDGLMEACAVRVGEFIQQPPVGRQSLQHIGGGAHLLLKGQVRKDMRHWGFCRRHRQKA